MCDPYLCRVVLYTEAATGEWIPPVCNYGEISTFGRLECPYSITKKIASKIPVNCGSVSVLDPYSGALWILIRIQCIWIHNTDFWPDIINP